MPPYSEADTIITAPPTATMAAVSEPEPRGHWWRGCLLAALTAGTLAWVAVCLKVIWLAWG